MNQKDLEMLEATGLRVIVIDENTVFPEMTDEEDEDLEDELDEDCEDDEEVICSTCNGSGEGMYDGTRCRSCNGSGVEQGEKDTEDCDPPDDFGDDNYCDEEGNRL